MALIHGDHGRITQAEGAPDDGLDAALADALAEVPRGALALAGTALGVVLGLWLLVYFAIYLPRGMVG